MSNANEVKLSYAAEATWGELPESPPTLQDIRFTSESLKQDTSTVVSKEIRSDRQTAGLFRTNINASGDIAFELSYGSFDAFLCAALFAASWSAEAVFDPGVTITAAAVDQSFSGTGVGALFTVGEWIRVSGFTNATNNGFFRITSKTNDKLVVFALGGAIVNETVLNGTGLIFYQGATISNGKTQTSFTIEKHFTDMSEDEFAYYLGMVIDSLSLNISPEEIITGTFGFMGYQETTSDDTIGDGTNTEASANEVVNAVDHITAIAIYSDGLVKISDLSLLNLSIELKNNVRSRLKIAHLGPFSMGAGKCEVSGKVQAYFESAALITPYLAAEELGLSVAITDVDGASYVIELPSIKFSGGQRVCGGENTDIVEDMEFTAYRDETRYITIGITRFSATPPSP